MDVSYGVLCTTPGGVNGTVGQIVDLVEALLNHHSATTSSRSNALTALAKVAFRLGGVLGEEKGRVEKLLESYRTSITLELQQRWADATRS